MNKNENVEIKTEEKGASFKDKVKRLDEKFNGFTRVAFNIIAVILVAVWIFKPSVYNDMIEKAEKTSGNKYGRLADGSLDNGKPLEETKEDKVEESEELVTEDKIEEEPSQEINVDSVDCKVVTETQTAKPEVICTKSYYEELTNGQCITCVRLDELVRNFDCYKGKRIHLEELEILEVNQIDGEPFYTCYDPYGSNQILIYIKFDNSQIQQNFMVGDVICTTGLLLDILEAEDNVYGLAMTTNCIVDNFDNYYLQWAYTDLKNMGDYNYELRSFKRDKEFDGRSLFKAININTGEVKYISNDGYGSVWRNEDWTPLDGGNMKAEGGEYTE